MRVRHSAAAEHEPVGDLPPAEDIKAEPAGEEPQGGKGCVLFPGGRSCEDHYQPGYGTHSGIKAVVLKIIIGSVK